VIELPGAASNQPFSEHYSQAEVLGERIKIPVVVQQVIPTLDAAGGNHRIDGLSNGHTKQAQRPKILRCLNRDLLSAQVHDRQRVSAGPSKTR
jgi:hypothetical protein